MKYYHTFIYSNIITNLFSSIVGFSTISMEALVVPEYILTELRDSALLLCKFSYIPVAYPTVTGREPVPEMKTNI